MRVMEFPNIPKNFHIVSSKRCIKTLRQDVAEEILKGSDGPCASEEQQLCMEANASLPARCLSALHRTALCLHYSDGPPPASFRTPSRSGSSPFASKPPRIVGLPLPPRYTILTICSLCSGGLLIPDATL
ncbi:hypothetical protein CRENBAI_013471 [Crenichthys baileyi]|uniref:Uncharacterized protein n=1 Tax=Crenichthys baileyi TaxID=28760 RepID=A0AAV9SJ61_9TELE